MSDVVVDMVNEKESAFVFEVQVNEGSSSTNHTVTVPKDYYRDLAPEGVGAKMLVEESFEFLLEREPKESILSSFDLPTISSYFPEYEEKITHRLS